MSNADFGTQPAQEAGVLRHLEATRFRACRSLSSDSVLSGHPSPRHLQTEGLYPSRIPKLNASPALPAPITNTSNARARFLRDPSPPARY